MIAKRLARLLVGASCILACLLSAVLRINAQAPAVPAADGSPLVTVKELMEKTITPATDTLWNVPDVPTDAEWAALEEAAVTLLVAANVVALGGTGPMDDAWAKEPAWAAFNRAMILAGREALAATRARDRAALLAAGDVLYPSCEGCHSLFNPGVVETK